MTKKFWLGPAISALAIGGICLLMALFIAVNNGSDYETHNSYGGDAYTGIQNASATTANNVASLESKLSECFSCYFFVNGAILTASGIFGIVYVSSKKK